MPSSPLFPPLSDFARHLPGRRLCSICAQLSGLPVLPRPACAAIFVQPTSPPRPPAKAWHQHPPSATPDPLLAKFGITFSPADSDHTQVTIDLAAEKFRERFGVNCPRINYSDARYLLKKVRSGAMPKLKVSCLSKALKKAARSKAVKPVTARVAKRQSKQASGLSPERIAFIVSNAFLASYEWRKLRYEAIKRSDGRCEACGRGKVHGAVLNVDHIKPRRRFPELALVLSNLQVACDLCNHGKGNWDQTNWRDKNARLSDAMDSSVPWYRFESF